MKPLHFLLIAAMVFPMNGMAADAALLELRTAKGTQPLPGSKTWGKPPGTDVILPLHLRGRVRPSQLIVGRNHPNGTKFMALFPGLGVMLPVDYPKNFRGFDQFGDLADRYWIEVGEHDFDSDGSPEIVVAIGNGESDLIVDVIKYRAPASKRDAERESNWRLLGSFAGTSKAVISRDRIELQQGSEQPPRVVPVH